MGEDYEAQCIATLPSDFMSQPYVLGSGAAQYLFNMMPGPVLSNSLVGAINLIKEDFLDIIGGVHWLVVFLMFITPIGLGLFSILVEEDIGFFFHISNYMGYLFSSLKSILAFLVIRYVLCLAVQLLNLVIFTIYFWYLENHTDFKKSMGE